MGRQLGHGDNSFGQFDAPCQRTGAGRIFSIHSVAVKSYVSAVTSSTMADMPKIWSQTIEAHRDAVREATINATAALVAEHGLTGVTMSQIAKDTGIGRATLYKYFPDVESILRA